MKRSYVLMAGLIAAITYVTYALAAGQFSQYPVVGGAAYCGANAQAGIPGTSTVCVPGGTSTSVPAGPTIVTGSEIVPADAGTTSTGNATYVLTLGSLNAYPYQWFTQAATPVTTYIMSDKQGGLFIDSTGTITSVVVQLPPNPIDGQRFWFSADRTVTALLVSPGSGASMGNSATPTALTISSTGTYGYEWLYRLTNTTWYRIR